MEPSCGCTRELDCEEHSCLRDFTLQAIAEAGVTAYEGKVDGAGFKTVMAEPKDPLDLIPPQFLEDLSKVLLYGLKKYAKNNWVRGMSWECTTAAALRHIMAFRRGEEMDPDSGLPHVLHAAFGMMALHWYAHGPRAEEYAKLDDRAFKGLPHKEGSF